MEHKHPQPNLRKEVTHLLGLVVFLMLTVFCSSTPAFAQDKKGAENTDVESETPVAPVMIDGKALFSVRGNQAISPEERARGIAGRIRSVAANPNVSISDVRAVEIGFGTGVFAGDQRLMVVFDGDAQLASLPRLAMADLVVLKIQEGITDYRQARSRQSIIRSAAIAGVATLMLVGIVLLVIWLHKRLFQMLERRYRRRIQSVGIQSFQVVRAEQIWNTLQQIIRGGRLILLLLIFFFYLNYVLARFPWTRAAAQQMRGYVIRPLEIIGRGILNHIPAIIFLLILYFITRATVKLIHKFFDALGRGEVKLSGFDAEWSESTYKLIRLAIVVLALVVAYPYIPGGGSEAFKGITIFIGLVFSLGSSSAIANLIAGYTMTYRRAFRVGDRVKIGDTMGDVTEMRLQVTHLKTVKNEEVIIPNSQILNNEVINYSSLASNKGLILHSTVGIGYETPWRQVEAMLLMAADRTSGILKDPPPFVQQKALGDFAVAYEINVYSDNAQTMGLVYTRLHRNVLDLFNEYGVQIMTPAYESDPNEPKLVPKEQWFSAPANGAERVMS